LRRGTFSPAGGSQASRVEWHGVRLHEPDWSHESRSLAMHLNGRPANQQDHIYLIVNAHWEAHEFELPVIPGWEWRRVVDTSEDPPLDISDPSEPAIPVRSRVYPARARSVIVLVGREPA
jgi:glycogen operon protein